MLPGNQKKVSTIVSSRVCPLSQTIASMSVTTNRRMIITLSSVKHNLLCLKYISELHIFLIDILTDV